MIYDLLVEHQSISKRVDSLCRERKILVLVTPTIAKQLKASPFRGVPDIFPVKYIGESVLLSGGSVGDRVGKGVLYKAHMGNSIQFEDALIADTADCDADLLVSNDKRLKNRMEALARRCKVLTFEGFQSWLDEKFGFVNTAL